MTSQQPRRAPRPVDTAQPIHAQASITTTATAAEKAATRADPPFPDPTKGFDVTAARDFANLLVGYCIEPTFAALADPTRCAMLDRLATGEKSVGALTCGFAMSDAGAAKHLAVLEAAGLIRRRRDGRRTLCALDADPLAEAALWLRRWQAFDSPRAGRLRAMIETAERLA